MIHPNGKFHNQANVYLLEITNGFISEPYTITHLDFPSSSNSNYDVGGALDTTWQLARISNREHIIHVNDSELMQFEVCLYYKMQSFADIIIKFKVLWLRCEKLMIIVPIE